jgi:LacI family transcriptional regulator
LLDDEFVRAASSRRIPVVNVAGRTQPAEIVSVLSDDVACGQLAANYFLDRGFSNFAFVGNIGPLFAQERASGFIDFLEKLGHPAIVLQSTLGEETNLVPWLQSLPRPTAIYCSSDRRAAAVLEACWQANLRIPEDVSVLGVGDHRQLCELCTPTLSSIDLDMEARGYEAASLLFRLLSGDPAPTRPVRVAPAGVVTRRSTDSFAYDDPDLINALRFIHDNADQSIKVRDVVAATKISRRSLENRFSKYFSRSLHEEIWRVHFDCAKQLLTTTDYSLQEIAERSGFRTASALANLFKQKTGLTPRTYRAEHRR